jgi:hypothetical protein
MKWLRYFERFLRRKRVTDGGTEKEVEDSCCRVLLNSFSCLSHFSHAFLLCFSLISHHPFFLNFVTKNTHSPFLSYNTLSCCLLIFSEVTYFSWFIFMVITFVSIKFQGRPSTVISSYFSSYLAYIHQGIFSAKRALWQSYTVSSTYKVKWRVLKWSEVKWWDVL